MDNDNWPQWLKDANTEDADVFICDDGIVDWRGGDWYGGNWRGGVWRGGVWRDTRINRLEFMASMCGIVFNEDDGIATAYRSTRANCHGRYDYSFIQKEGRINVHYAPAGVGTCVEGLHATSMGKALVYFGIDNDALLWEVKFARDDLLDCDCEKVRLKGGTCRQIPWPFFKGA